MFKWSWIFNLKVWVKSYDKKKSQGSNFPWGTSFQNYKRQNLFKSNVLHIIGKLRNQTLGFEYRSMTSFISQEKTITKNNNNNFAIIH